MKQYSKYGIFTKPIHVEMIVNFLNKIKLDYIISTKREEINLFNFDIGVSYCFPYIVDVDYPVRDSRKWFNYHPAPLPEYPGLNNYSFAIRDNIKKFGVTLHVMTHEVDKGEIIKKIMFPLISKPVNTDELGKITHYYLFQLFKETIEKLE